eukprot:831112-Prymnesium_polylepis.1
MGVSVMSRSITTMCGMMVASVCSVSTTCCGWEIVPRESLPSERANETASSSTSTPPWKRERLPRLPAAICSGEITSC